MNTFLIIGGFVALGAGIAYFISAAALLFFRDAKPIYRFGPFLILVSGFLSSFIDSPGSWSDVRSQWLPSAIGIFLLLMIGLLGFFSTFRGKLRIERTAGIVALLFFTFSTPFTIGAGLSHILFFDEVRKAQETWKS
jgi:hypothetical protein